MKTDTEEFEVLIAADKKSSAFWNKTTCNLLKVGVTFQRNTWPLFAE
jgi:hypothetical protein